MKSENLSLLNVLMFFACLQKVDNIFQNFESDLINNLFSHLSKWKPECEIVLVHPCNYSWEFKDFGRLVKRNPRVSVQLIWTGCEDIENTLGLALMSKRNHTRETFYIFNSNDSSETMRFIKIVNQAEKDAQSNPETRKRWSPFYFFVWPNNLQNSLEIWPNSMNVHDISNLTTDFRLNSNAYFVFCCDTSNKKETVLRIFEFYNLLTANIITNLVLPKNFGQKGQNRMNFHGIQLRATAPRGNLTQGEIVWGRDDSKNLIFTAGFGTSILKSFQHSMNFQIVAIPTDGWATLFPNGSWNGMANEILQGRADIGIAKTSILPARAKALGYLIPIHTLIVTSFFRQPPISTTRNIFIHPFETRLWLIIICTWIVILVSVMSLALCKLKSHNYLDNNDEIIMQAIGIWAITAITQHGFYKMPHSVSLRIVILVGIFVGVVIFVAYSATLVSIFTSKPIPIKTFKDLLTSSLKFRVDTNNIGARLLSTHSADTSSAAMYSQTANLLMDKVSTDGNHSFVNATFGGGLVFDKNVAFLTFEDTFYTTVRNAYKKTDRFLCNTLSSFSVSTIPFRSGLFVAKNSPYKEMFNNKLICLYSSGIMRKYVRDYEATYTPICNPGLEIHDTPSLGPSDVFFSYILLICGSCSSVLILLAELLYFQKF